jgi:hypothetical protein
MALTERMDMTEPSNEELLATVREAIDEACVHDTDHAGAYPALDALAARLEAAELLLAEEMRAAGILTAEVERLREALKNAPIPERESVLDPDAWGEQYGE